LKKKILKKEINKLIANKLKQKNIPKKKTKKPIANKLKQNIPK